MERKIFAECFLVHICFKILPISILKFKTKKNGFYKQEKHFNAALIKKQIAEVLKTEKERSTDQKVVLKKTTKNAFYQLIRVVR